MPSLLPDYEYDIFISYRQKDNKVDGWVTSFVADLKAELDATLKNPVSVYVDDNPHDGPLETHQVGASLDRKLKCLIFIPIVPQTYCDPDSYAWQSEFLPFLKQAAEDPIGLNVTLANGNVASRVLPVQIHDLDAGDRGLLEKALGGPMRAVPFVYASPGVNRPLRAHEEHAESNKHRLIYRDQVNKVANAIKEVTTAALHPSTKSARQATPAVMPQGKAGLKRWVVAAVAVVVLLAAAYAILPRAVGMDASQVSLGVIPFRNNTGDAGMSHYGVGIASEVATQLGLTKQFDFISSLQATIRYQQSDKSPMEIGQELGVTHILTGMYQTAGDNIQVSVQLVDASSGKMIWSLPYKTRYNDIFEVQGNIARRVMEKFSVKEGPEVMLKTPNLEAYAHMMKGFEIVLKSNRPEDRMKAVAEYQQAIALDSSFIEPWAGIIEEYCYYYWNRGPESKLTLEMIQAYMDYVDNHFPDDWKKNAVKGTYEYWALAHYQKGLDYFLEALNVAPTNGGIHSTVAAIYRRQLKLPEALEHISVSLKENPSAVIYWNELVPLFQLNGDYENAIKAANTVYQFNTALMGNLYRLRIWTNSLSALPDEMKKRVKFYEPDSLLMARNFEGLQSWVIRTQKDPWAMEVAPFYLAAVYHVQGKDSEAEKQARAYMESKDRSPERRATMLALLGWEKEFKEELQQVGKNLEEDLSLQWDKQTDWIMYSVMRKDYEKATQLLIELNASFPQVGDYSWLALPTYDRAKREYPPFAEAVKNLKLPPKLNTSSIIGM
jgi:TolB-like protein